MAPPADQALGLRSPVEQFDSAGSYLLTTDLRRETRVRIRDRFAC